MARLLFASALILVAVYINECREDADKNSAAYSIWEAFDE